MSVGGRKGTDKEMEVGEDQERRAGQTDCGGYFECH